MFVLGSSRQRGGHPQRLGLRVVLLSGLLAQWFALAEGSSTMKYWVTTTYYRQKPASSVNTFKSQPGYTNPAQSNTPRYSTITKYWKSDSRQTTNWNSNSRQTTNWNSNSRQTMNWNSNSRQTATSNFIPRQGLSTLQPGYSASPSRQLRTPHMNSNSGHTISMLTAQHSQPTYRQTQTLHYNTNKAQSMPFNPSVSTFSSRYAQPSSTGNPKTQSTSHLRTSQNSPHTSKQSGYMQTSLVPNSNSGPQTTTWFHMSGPSSRTQYPTSIPSTLPPYITRQSPQVTRTAHRMPQGSSSISQLPSSPAVNTRTMLYNKVTGLTAAAMTRRQTPVGRVTLHPLTSRAWPVTFRGISTQKPGSYTGSSRYTNNQQYTDLFTNFPLWQSVFTTNKH